MAGMDPETGFMTEAKILFKDEKVVYIKVAKGGQPICRWLEEWQDIAKKNGLDENHIKRIHKGGKVEFYQPILDQYKGMLKKHPKFKSKITINRSRGGGPAAYASHGREGPGGSDPAACFLFFRCCCCCLLLLLLLSVMMNIQE